MSEFEIWFYRAMITGTLIIIGFWLKNYVGKQDEKNEKFFELLGKNEKAVTRLNDILDANDRLCSEKHTTLNKRLDKIEEKLS